MRTNPSFVVIIILGLLFASVFCRCFQLLLPERIAGLSVHVGEDDVEDIAVPVYGVAFYS